MPKGFASLSKSRRKEIAQAGGEASAAVYKRTGKGHAWSPEEAKRIGLAAVARTLRKNALNAALVLLKAGYSASELNAAALTDKEYIKLAKDATSERTERRIRGNISAK